MVKRNNCPVCQASAIKEVFLVKDFSVSGEEFPVMECTACSFRFTDRVPEESEIGRYYQSEEYISHSNTSKGFINNLYQKIRRRTLKSKRVLVERFTNGKRGNILDVGCGTGNFLNEMKSAGWNVTGVEPDETARKNASELFGIQPLPPEEFLKFSPSQFEVVTLWHVLEHVYSLDAYLIQLKSILKPGGKIFIAVPNHNSHDAKKYGKGWAAYDVPRHLYHWNPSAMKTMLTKNGFRLLDMKKMPFDSFYVSMLSEKYRQGSMIKAVWIGGISWLKAIFNKEKCSSLIYVIEPAK